MFTEEKVTRDYGISQQNEIHDPRGTFNLKDRIIYEAFLTHGLSLGNHDALKKKEFLVELP